MQFAASALHSGATRDGAGRIVRPSAPGAVLDLSARLFVATGELGAGMWVARLAPVLRHAHNVPEPALLPAAAGLAARAPLVPLAPLTVNGLLARLRVAPADLGQKQKTEESYVQKLCTDFKKSPRMSTSSKQSTHRTACGRNLLQTSPHSSVQDRSTSSKHPRTGLPAPVRGPTSSKHPRTGLPAPVQDAYLLQTSINQSINKRTKGDNKLPISSVFHHLNHGEPDNQNTR